MRAPIVIAEVRHTDSAGTTLSGYTLAAMQPTAAGRPNIECSDASTLGRGVSATAMRRQPGEHPHLLKHRPANS